MQTNALAVDWKRRIDVSVQNKPENTWQQIQIVKTE